MGIIHEVIDVCNTTQEDKEELKAFLEGEGYGTVTGGLNDAYWFRTQDKWRRGCNKTPTITLRDFLHKYRRIKGNSMKYDKLKTVCQISSEEEHDVVREFLGFSKSYEYESYVVRIGYNNRGDIVWTSHTRSGIDNSDWTTLPYKEYYDYFIKPLGGTKEPEEELQLWKNPKPLQENQREILLNSLVVVDGMPLGLRVISVGNFYVHLEGISDAHNVKDCYPIYESKITPDTPLKIGDIVVVNEAKKVVTRILKDSFYSKGVVYNKHDIVRRYSLKPDAMTITKYACGTLKLGGKAYKSMEEIREEYATHKFKVTNILTIYAYEEIAKHYDIVIDDLMPKDESISKDVMEALEHPLNIEAKEWVYLWGDSGSGKSRAAMQYVKDIERAYVMLQGHQQMSADDLIGYKSIVDGKYYASLLRDAVENGKVLVIDEIDAISPAVLIVLNGLKHDYFQFPDRRVKVHQDFRLIATANTFGEYSEEFNARTPLDKATLSRFKAIEYNLKDYHLAIRYGLNYIKELDIRNLHPRDVERLVRELKVSEIEEVNKIK